AMVEPERIPLAAAEATSETRTTIVGSRLLAAAGAMTTWAVAAPDRRLYAAIVIVAEILDLSSLRALGVATGTLAIAVALMGAMSRVQAMATQILSIWATTIKYIWATFRATLPAT